MQMENGLMTRTKTGHLISNDIKANILFHTMYQIKSIKLWASSKMRINNIFLVLLTTSLIFTYWTAVVITMPLIDRPAVGLVRTISLLNELEEASRDGHPICPFRVHNRVADDLPGGLVVNITEIVCTSQCVICARIGRSCHQLTTQLKVKSYNLVSQRLEDVVVNDVRSGCACLRTQSGTTGEIIRV